MTNEIMPTYRIDENAEFRTLAQKADKHRRIEECRTEKEKNLRKAYRQQQDILRWLRGIWIFCCGAIACTCSFVAIEIWMHYPPVLAIFPVTCALLAIREPLRRKRR